LENWRIGEEMAVSVGEQSDFDREYRPEPDLTDVLIVSIVLAEALGASSQKIDTEEARSFRNIGLTSEVCMTTLKHAKYRLASLHESLGC